METTLRRALYNAIRAVLIAALSITGATSATTTSPEFSGARTGQAGHLHRTLSTLDGQFTQAYNDCATARLRSFFSTDAEFYFGGYGRASRLEVIDGIRGRACGRYIRRVDPASLEVFDLPGFGAIQTGRQQFCSTAKPACAGVASDFVAVWRQLNGEWKIVRLVRYGYHQVQ